MKYKVEIQNIEIIDEITNYWTNEDYIHLLEKFEFPDAQSIKRENLLEYLKMAISDFEPKDVAKILLEYKLSEDLTEGQIDQISNDMLLDKVCEEYPVITLHAKLFHVNQLLFKAYNGTFPNAKASIISCSFEAIDAKEETKITKEMALVLLKNGLSGSNLIKRMFEAQLNQEVHFNDAEGIVWYLESEDCVNYKLTTSEYWISREDIVASEFEGVFVEAE
ncbi:MAG: hypothetical protein EOO46_09030 [Flavobacterium sp.]|nr:MAG: hypothetical protein EOO46_09030 [Flavobacterium sp.]